MQEAYAMRHEPPQESVDRHFPFTRFKDFLHGTLYSLKLDPNLAERHASIIYGIKGVKNILEYVKRNFGLDRLQAEEFARKIIREEFKIFLTKPLMGFSEDFADTFGDDLYQAPSVQEIERILRENLPVKLRSDSKRKALTIALAVKAQVAEALPSSPNDLDIGGSGSPLNEDELKNAGLQMGAIVPEPYLATETIAQSNRERRMTMQAAGRIKTQPSYRQDFGDQVTAVKTVQLDSGLFVDEDTDVPRLTNDHEDTTMRTFDPANRKKKKKK